MLASRIAIQRIIGSYYNGPNISNILSTHQTHQTHQICQIHHPIKRMMNTNSNTDSNYTNKKDQKEYTLTLLELIGKVQDTHANIWGQNKILTDFFGVNFVPISLTFIENKAVVVKLESEFKDTSVKVGDIITEINGIKVEDWIAANKKYFPASNYPTQLRDMAGKLLRTNQKKLEVTIDTGSEIKKVTLATIPHKYFREEQLERADISTILLLFKFK